MTTNPHNPNRSAPDPASAEETLRIVAGLPAPAGLEDRVRSALREAHHRDRLHRIDSIQPARRGQLLAWPTALKPQSGWMRTAAAAAIVFVVAGGGWGVYSRVEQNRPAKVLVMPHVNPPGGFAGAGAMRVPQTIPGPAAPRKTQALRAGTAAIPSAPKKAAAKTAPRSAPTPATSTPSPAQQ